MHSGLDGKQAGILLAATLDLEDNPLVPAMYKEVLAMGAAGLRWNAGISHLVLSHFKAEFAVLAVVPSQIPSLPS